MRATFSISSNNIPLSKPNYLNQYLASKSSSRHILPNYSLFV